MYAVYPCNPCDRDFNTSNALGQHRKFSTAHEYCWRCRRSFASLESWRQHVVYSQRHHECDYCEIDAPSREDLREHLRDEHHLYSCGQCSHVTHDEWDLDEHERVDHNKCLCCGLYFETPANLRAHQVTHRPRNIECLACTDCFTSQSAMILHLEGFCHTAQFTEADVTDIAMQCYASKRYRSGNPMFPFECPTCPSQFRVISALFQHVESEACGEDLSVGSPLDRFFTFLAKKC